MRWWTSDLHLGHANIIRYCDRPFGSADEMDRELVGRWNDTVEQDDEIWVLGDFALGGLERHLPLAGCLRGRKVLVPGNHDACWAGRSKDVERWTQAYLDAGFERVVPGPLHVSLGGRDVLVDHFPYHGDSNEHERFAEHRPVDRGGWILHGHVHDRWRQAGRQINVGVDAWGGGLVHEEEIATLVDAGPAERAALPWPAGARGQRPPLL